MNTYQMLDDPSGDNFGPYIDIMVAKKHTYIGLQLDHVIMTINLKSDLHKGDNYATGRSEWRDRLGRVYYFNEQWVERPNGWRNLNFSPRQC